MGPAIDQATLDVLNAAPPPPMNGAPASPSPSPSGSASPAPAAPAGGSASSGAGSSDLSPDVLAVLNAPPSHNAVGASPPMTRAQEDSLATYGKQSLGSDIAMSILDALPKGAAKLFGSFGDIQALGDRIAGYLGDKLGLPSGQEIGDRFNGYLEQKHREMLTGLGYSPERIDQILATNRDPGALGGALMKENMQFPTSGDIRVGMEKLAGQPLYEPQTPAGKYAGATVEGAASMPFAPGVGALSGAGGEAGANLLGEKYGRLVGSLLGVSAGALVSYLRSAPEAVIQNALKTVSDDELAKAQTLMDKAAESGTPLTGAEALGRVIGPNRLNDLQRVLERSRQGAPYFEKMMAARPEANAAAFDEVAGKVSPPISEPTEIAPAVQQAAESRVNETRQTINETARPFYAAAESQAMPESAFAGIKDNPLFQAALSKVRGDPVYAALKDLPDNNIAVIDAVKKQLGETADAFAPNIAQAGSKTREAAYAGAKQTVEGQARLASPDYNMALGIETQGREQFLDPLKRSITGQLAAADKFPEQAAIVFERNPLPGSETGVADAIKSVAKRDPEAAAQFVRAKLEQAFNQVTRQLTGGPNQFGGAGFAADIAGNSQQAKNLKAAIEALPNGQEASDAFQNLLRIFQAQGMRARAGSQTTFNAELQSELSRGANVGELVAKAARPTTMLSDTFRRALYYRNSAKLAEILTDPKSASLMQQIAKLDPESDAAKALGAFLVAGGAGQVDKTGGEK